MPSQNEWYMRICKFCNECKPHTRLGIYCQDCTKEFNYKRVRNIPIPEFARYNCECGKSILYKNKEKHNNSYVHKSKMNYLLSPLIKIEDGKTMRYSYTQEKFYPFSSKNSLPSSSPSLLFSSPPSPAAN